LERQVETAALASVVDDWWMMNDWFYFLLNKGMLNKGFILMKRCFVLQTSVHTVALYTEVFCQ
jgi:hypothetical protein